MAVLTSAQYGDFFIGGSKESRKLACWPSHIIRFGCSSQALFYKVCNSAFDWNRPLCHSLSGWGGPLPSKQVVVGWFIQNYAQEQEGLHWPLEIRELLMWERVICWIAWKEYHDIYRWSLIKDANMRHFEQSITCITMEFFCCGVKSR